MARNKSKAKAKTKKKVPAKPAKKAAVKAKTKAPVVKAKAVKAKPVAKAATQQKGKAVSWRDLFTPLDDRVLIEVEPMTQTAGGLFIPATVTDRPQRGTVLAIGRGRRDKKGRVRPMDVSLGDEVLIGPHAGTTLNLEGRDIIILRETDLLGIVE